MKTLLAVVLLLLVLVVAVPMISGTGGERTDKPIEGLPWQIESLPDGRSLDSVKQDGRFTDKHLGRSTGMIVGGYSVMLVAPSS